MFSSKTLEQRNNDPRRFVNNLDGSRWRDDGGDPELLPFRPHAGHQHGKLPANPILISFRETFGNSHPLGVENTPDLAEAWLDNWNALWFLEVDKTRAQRAHARRVLTLLATLNESSL